MIRIYRESWRALTVFWPMVLGIAVLNESTNLWMPNPTTTLGVEIVITTLFAYYVCRFFLFGESFSTKKENKAEPDHIGMFLLVSAVLGVVLMLVTMLCALTILPSTFSGDTLPALGAGLIIYALLLSAFGTMLPAAAAGQDAGPATAWTRGRKTFFSTLLCLVTGPGVVLIVTVTVSLVLTFVFALPTDTISGSDGPSAIGFAVGSGLNAMGLLITLATVTVLSLAYKRTAPTTSWDEIFA